MKIFNKITESVSACWGGGGKLLIVVCTIELIICVILGFKYLNLKSFMTNSVNAQSDYWCMEGWQNTLEKLNYDCDICFFGNSLTCYSDFQKFFPEKRIVNLGYPSQGIRGMLKRYKSISFVKPEKIFIMAGINDLNLETLTIGDFCGVYETLIDSIIATNKNAKVFLESVLPVNHRINSHHPSTINIKTANEFISKLALKKHVEYIDLYSLYADDKGELKDHLTWDGLHLKQEAYQLWADKLKQYIEIE